MPEILIIGAGLTGLSAAFHLNNKSAHENGSNTYGPFEKKLIERDIEVFEAEQTPGGLLRSVRKNGYTFDYTGHLLHSNNHYFSHFLDQIFPRIKRDFVERKAAVFSHNLETPYPFQLNLYGLPADVITECITGFTKRSQDIKTPQTFYQWVLKHFGPGLGKHFFFPFQKKILSYDVRKIEPSWTGRFVPKTNLADMIKNALIKPELHTQRVGYNSRFFYPKQGGIDHLIRALLDNISSPVTTGHRLVSLDINRKVAHFANGQSVKYQKLISTIPLPNLLGSITHESRTTIAEHKNKLRCNSVLNINIGINRDNITDKQWFYVPEEKYPFYRLGFWHNISKSLAPAGKSSLYAEVSFMGDQISQNKQNDKIKSLTEQTITSIKEIYNISESEIDLIYPLLLKNAYVLYTPWRKKNLSKILETLASYDIHSIGRYGAWKYSSMQEGLLDGKDIAEQLEIPENKIVLDQKLYESALQKLSS